jgi:gamma-tubulin complex component 5
LAGLEEKFRVYNEDPLADALRERVDETQRLGGKWTPDILHLLLELSDKPLSETRLKDLDLLTAPPEEDAGPPLRWKDLVGDDGLPMDKNVWRNVDFGAESSTDEDGFEDGRSELSVGLSDSTGQSSVDDAGRYAEKFIIDTVDSGKLDELLNAQFWRKIPSVNGVRLETVKKPITELQAVRETLFMLNGFPSSLFEMGEGKKTVVTASKGFALRHLSTEAFQILTDEFAELGSAILTLRSWTKRPQSVPLLQVMQYATANRVRGFDEYLADIQRRFVDPSADVVVSLLRLKTEISTVLRPLSILSAVVKRLEAEPYSHAFRYLELLYDETCTSQMAGDDEIYVFVGRIFFECFQVYLRPIRTWMEEGELDKSDTVFFVSEVATRVDQASVWQSRFRIRRAFDDSLHVPRFLHAAANKIFTTGKSVVILKYLNQFESLQTSRSTAEPILDFDTVCNTAKLQLAPFPQLFDVAFDNWIQSKHHYASATLRKTLFDGCGLHTALEALSHIYFMRDGASAATFTNPLFDRLDTLDESWSDNFTVTELAQSSFGALPSVRSDLLGASILTMPRRFREVADCRRSVKTLAAVQIKYHVSWPIQIILTQDSMASYRKIFTFLLQIRRTSHILSREQSGSPRHKPTSSREGALYYSLRSRLLWFTSTLYNYLTVLIIDTNTQRMLTRLEQAADVDGMIEAHASYVKTIVSQLLLGSKLEPIHKSILRILNLGIKLEDAKAMNAARKREEEAHGESGLVSVSSRLQREASRSKRGDPDSLSRQEDEITALDDDAKDITVDLSILSSTYNEDDGDEAYVRRLRADFDAQLQFLIGGLRGVARAGEADQARCWEVLAEMLDGGIPGATASERAWS